MKAVGLYPSNTGKPGGKETGQRMSHYVMPGGPFAKAFMKLAATGFELRWQSRSFVNDPERKKKAKSKTRYTCSRCGQNAWAKPDTLLICGGCFHSVEGGVCICMMDPA